MRPYEPPFRRLMVKLGIGHLWPLYNLPPHRDALPLIPKSCEILAVNPLALKRGARLAVGRRLKIRGRGICHDRTRTGTRTVFFCGDVHWPGERYFLTLKGYGENGRAVYPNLHCEGDLFYGLRHSYAMREFDLPTICRAAGITNVQLPVAVLRFREKDFVRHAMIGLAKLIQIRLHLSKHTERIRFVAKRLLGVSALEHPSERRCALLGCRIAHRFWKLYLRRGLATACQLASQVGLGDEIAGLRSTVHDPARCVILGVRSPIRIGSHSDPGLATPLNCHIARMIGRTVRRMLEIGLYPWTPHPGNWTQVGEFVDFEDVTRWPPDPDELDSILKFHQLADVDTLIRFSFGEPCLGPLATPFHEGFIGRPSSLDEVVTIAKDVIGRFEPVPNCRLAVTI